MGERETNEIVAMLSPGDEQNQFYSRLFYESF